MIERRFAVQARQSVPQRYLPGGLEFRLERQILAVAVTDEAGRFLGAVTVDDVIDRMLGDGWRTNDRRRRRTASDAAVSP